MPRSARPWCSQIWFGADAQTCTALGLRNAGSGRSTVVECPLVQSGKVPPSTYERRPMMRERTCPVCGAGSRAAPARAAALTGPTTILPCSTRSATSLPMRSAERKKRSKRPNNATDPGGTGPSREPGAWSMKDPRRQRAVFEVSAMNVDFLLTDPPGASAGPRRSSRSADPCRSGPPPSRPRRPSASGSHAPSGSPCRCSWWSPARWAWSDR